MRTTYDGAFLSFILALLMGALLAGSACSTSTVSDVSRADTALQRRLDLHGIDLSLPARGKLILVNVPAFELVAIEDGQEAFRSRIIVGKPATPTPLIDTRVTAVRFRPSWRPTPSMVASGEYEDRVWPPGDNNPLGLAAIRLEPPLLVYLHDTNQRHLFERDYRAISHGCIRVERWDWLAAWVLDVPLANVLARAHGSTTHDLTAPGIPVVIRYYTRFPDPNGQVRSFPDIYRRNLISKKADQDAVCRLS
ncbi:MAG: L,D-transpeptidase family protein [Paracoccaceae bacterium]|nr:L,D-transpeptidase family protein [Paracoccaceae bacterium]